LSAKKGELTSTMSLRRKNIYTHFATDIENLYTTKDGAKGGGLDMVIRLAPLSFYSSFAKMSYPKTTSGWK